jgi:hypothetical protein
MLDQRRQWMTRLLPVLALMALSACAGLGTQKVSGDENQVVLSAADQQKAQQHCASYGKDAINLGPGSGSNVTYACRPRRT